MRDPGEYLVFIDGDGEGIAGRFIDECQVAPDCQGCHVAVSNVRAFGGVCLRSTGLPPPAVLVRLPGCAPPLCDQPVKVPFSRKR